MSDTVSSECVLSGCSAALRTKAALTPEAIAEPRSNHTLLTPCLGAACWNLDFWRIEGKEKLTLNVRAAPQQGNRVCVNCWIWLPNHFKSISDCEVEKANFSEGPFSRPSDNVRDANAAN